MNTNMIARGLAGLVALACLAIGLLYMFNPAGVLEGAGFDPAGVSVLGLSTLRAVVGGAFITFAIVVGLHTVRKGDDEMIRLMVLFWLMYTVGRVVGIVSDGIVENTGERQSVISLPGSHTSRLLTSSAFFSMNSRLGSTSSPISVVKIWSAATASSIVTCNRRRVSGLTVVSHS